MKQSVILILLFIPTLLLARPSLTISLLVDKAQNSVDTSFQVKVYKGDRLLHDLTIPLFEKKTFDDVDTGSYRIEYMTIFKRLISQTLQITRDEEYYELLYLDSFDRVKDVRKSFVSSLQDGKSMKISFEAYGCYHWETQGIKITLMNGKYVATLYPEKLVRDKKKKGKTIIKSLTQQGVASIEELEHFILTNALPGGGSNETTSFKFEVNGIVWVFNLDEESRKPFYKLRETVFGQK